MRKLTFVIAILCLSVLTGCVQNKEDKAMQFVNESSFAMKASNEIDTKLMDRVKEFEENDVKFDQVEKEIWSARKIQLNTYEEFKQKKVYSSNAKLKTGYLELISHRIKVYDELLNISISKDYSSLVKLAEVHEIRDKELINGLTDKVNSALKEKEIKDLTKTINKEK